MEMRFEGTYFHPLARKKSKLRLGGYVLDISEQTNPTTSVCMQ